MRSLLRKIKVNRINFDNSDNDNEEKWCVWMVMSKGYSTNYISVIKIDRAEQNNIREMGFKKREVIKLAFTFNCDNIYSDLFI